MKDWYKLVISLIWARNNRGKNLKNKARNDTNEKLSTNIQKFPQICLINLLKMKAFRSGYSTRFFVSKNYQFWWYVKIQAKFEKKNFCENARTHGRTWLASCFNKWKREREIFVTSHRIESHNFSRNETCSEFEEFRRSCQSRIKQSIIDFETTVRHQ